MKEDGRVIVIGSGPAGSSAAFFLAEAGVDVLLLDAGPERSEQGLTLRVHGLTVAKRRRLLKQREQVRRTADPNTEVNEDLALGGLSNHWSCAVPRFAPEDFRAAEGAGEAYAWPVTYEDLAPFYDRVEPLLHISGSARSVASVPAGKVLIPRQLGADWAGLAAAAERAGRSVLPVPYAYGSDSTVTFSGTAFNAFVRLIQPILPAGKVTVRHGARALRLEWSAQRKRVSSVVVRDVNSGTESRLPCRAVVVAAGAINSAEILLASSDGEFPNGLGNTHGVLGRYLHDHPLAKLVVDLGSRITVQPAAYITRGALDAAAPLYAAAAIQWSGPKIWAKSILGLHPGRLPWLGFSIFGTMVPSTENWVALRREANQPDGLDVHISYPREAIDVLTDTRDTVLRLLQEAGLEPNVREWKLEAPGNSNHFAGTCRMHASPQFGMLDAYSRLHVASNVVVADSAAFTTSPEKNPVLTAMTLAARACTRLAEDIQRGDL